MKCVKAQKLMDLYLADDPLLDSTGRLRFEEHLQDCPRCRAAYDRGRQVVALIREYGQISEDTLALLSQAQIRRAPSRPLLVRCILRAGAVAACLVLAGLGWWAISGSQVPVTPPEDWVASSKEGMGLAIESVGDGTRISPGVTIQTFAGEIKRLVLNGRHQVVMNAGTRLSIEPLVEVGLVGCQVNLTMGEVYVHVERDGSPFVVRTDHGQAVITGTTFDVRVAETGTTLVVAEGGVRFESEGGAVQVMAGQQSMIAGASAPPGTPTACDTIALTAWAGIERDVSEVVQAIRPDDFLSDDLALFPSPRARTDLEGVNYAPWVEQNRDWFRRQFPDTFRLKTALAQEDVEVDYPDLLLESAVLWQFAWPPAGQDRLSAVDDAAILKAAGCYDKDSHWLKDRGLIPVAMTAPDGQKRMGEAFSLCGNRHVKGTHVGAEFGPTYDIIYWGQSRMAVP